MGELVAGTRGSALALAQTGIVCDALRRVDPSITVRVDRITTTGDARADLPLSQLGRGVFVTELESALRERRIDFAVHSAKDLPSTLANDLTLAAILPRADARDVVVSRSGALRDLPRGARVGTSSPRRACLLRAIRPDLEPVNVRGNVDTRLRKLAAGEFDALILAAAGLVRLGRTSEITEWLDTDTMIPSVGQGALAVETRADNQVTRALLARLDDAPTRAAVVAERAFLAELGAGCRVAAGAFAVDRNHRLSISAFIGGPDGRHVRTRRDSDRANARELGAFVARELLSGGAAGFLARPNSALSGRRVAVTRPAEQSRELLALLRANGADAISSPTIAIAPVIDSVPIDATVQDLGSIRWIVFTSANAVDAFADRLEKTGVMLPSRVKLASVGGATSFTLSMRIRGADFVPSVANAETLAAELPIEAGDEVLLPHGDLARKELRDGLSQRGARVRTIVVYRTVAASREGKQLATLVRAGELDAIVFASPSSVRFATGLMDAMRAAPFPRPAIICIGPTTSRTVTELGIAPDGEAATPTIGAVVEALDRCLAERQALAVAAS